MPGKVRVSRKEKPVRKRTLNRGLLLLGASLVFILGVILVSLLASGSLTKSASGTPSSVAEPAAPIAEPAAPDFQLTTFGGSEYALSQDQGKVRVVFFMIQPY